MIERIKFVTNQKKKRLILEYCEFVVGEFDLVVCYKINRKMQKRENGEILQNNSILLKSLLTYVERNKLQSILQGSVWD